MHFVFNSWTGYDIVDFLQSRALNVQGGPGFKFFETWDKYYFISHIDYLLNKKPEFLLKKSVNNNDVIGFTMYENLSVPVICDYDSMILDLGYSSTGYYLDPFNKKYVKDYVVDNPWEGAQTINEKTTPATNKMFRFEYNKNHPNMNDAHVKDMVQTRMLNETTMINNKITMSLAGHSKMKPGVTVVVNAKASDMKKDEHTDLRDIEGTWLVTSVTDIIADQWKQNITVQRLFN
jgi:hypothetical protein